MQKKTVLITGASRGIGAATSQIFAENNYQVVINYRHSEYEAKALCDALHAKGYAAMACCADVSSLCQVEEMVEKVSRHFGAIDVLVNNAGISKQVLFDEMTGEQWNEMMNVHVGGMFHCTKCVLPGMLNQKSGKIINVSSIWGMVGASMEVHYSTAKAAQIGFTKALAKELGPSHIQVNCIAPGIVDTDMNKDLCEEDREALITQTPQQRFATPMEIAHTILFLASPNADYMTGQVLSPNGGFVI